MLGQLSPIMLTAMMRKVTRALTWRLLTRNKKKDGIAFLARGIGTIKETFNFGLFSSVLLILPTILFCLALSHGVIFQRGGKTGYIQD